MIIETKEIKEVITKTSYCDLCKTAHSYRVCQECNRVVCKGHLVEIDNSSDYPDKYCVDCYEIIKAFQYNIDTLQEKQNRIYDTMGNELKRFRNSLKENK